MVGVAQRIERQTVALDAGGSNPLTHPFSFLTGDLNRAKSGIASERSNSSEWPTRVVVGDEGAKSPHPPFFIFDRGFE